MSDTPVESTEIDEQSTEQLEDQIEENGVENESEATTNTDEAIDPELEEMKRRYKEMEEETKKLNELQNSVDSNGFGDQEEIDARSVYVGNVEYTSTQEDILAYFQSCGTVNRITILNDKTTGHPKGCCYVEFVDRESVQNALVLNDTTFNNRQIKVTAKRTNLPAYMRGGRGGRGRARGARGVRGGRGFRGYGGRPVYHPYS
ncbi:polyadenylate-binding protein 2 [Heterostelium album PN500]|uniref:Polyadenylate-binding protein 2 n=1 Tax=Heterostelium pallidum (strain ATCC 26659 / Pp 5 / PN500) TaxID=670386 RepID=D3B5S1_HETP5|nr:polyadenylate-binding protein 2 [Heterostelium album PN500]EFA83219.1 polyadenylate-binding protein 2 [Heterostelium album PN500]|eukprot:XP_020435336.1 polyadenylate-binding protein 2 [Heterostelium album PN500]